MSRPLLYKKSAHWYCDFKKKIAIHSSPRKRMAEKIVEVMIFLEILKMLLSLWGKHALRVSELNKS